LKFTTAHVDSYLMPAEFSTQAAVRSSRSLSIWFIAMSQGNANEAGKAKWNAWPSWVAFAAVAVFMGLLLPQLLPGDLTAQNALTKAERKEKGKLEYAGPSLPEAPSTQGMIVRLVSGTAVVLGLCVLTLWGIKRWLHPAAAHGAGQRELRLLETLQLGNRCSLQLVHLGKQPILVGIDASGIKSIVPLPTPFEAALEDAEQGQVAEPTIPFPRQAA
jgi:flagellar biogenesis protein FliO